MGYQLEGRLLEVCNCNVLCPCWIGEDPDNGTCDAITAWHIDRGSIDGVDVSGLTVALFSHIPGNVLQGNHRVVFFLPEQTTPEQERVLIDTWTGKQGGPMADLGGLFGEIIAVERKPISFTVEGGSGTVRIGQIAEATMEPYQGATGQPTTLVDTAFSTIPGSPAYVSKASRYHRDASAYGMKNLSLEGHNAIQGKFRIEA